MNRRLVKPLQIPSLQGEGAEGPVTESHTHLTKGIPAMVASQILSPAVW